MNAINSIWAFVSAHQTTIALLGAWVFSVAMSTKPPLPANAGYWAVWVNDFLQAVAANLSKTSFSMPVAAVSDKNSDGSTTKTTSTITTTHSAGEDSRSTEVSSEHKPELTGTVIKSGR